MEHYGQSYTCASKSYIYLHVGHLTDVGRHPYGGTITAGMIDVTGEKMLQLAQIIYVLCAGGTTDLGLPNIQRLQQLERLDLMGQIRNVRLPEAQIFERLQLAVQMLLRWRFFRPLQPPRSMTFTR